MDALKPVSGKWLVRALVMVLIAAGVALYLTMCLLFYQGQWQFVFSPPKRVAERRALHVGALAGSWARREGPLPKVAFPSAAEVATSTGLPIEDHRFDYTEEGAAQLDGWWIPISAKPGSETAGQPPPLVVLYCPDGHSNLPGNAAAFQALHALGVSIFAFDYRGFGHSQAGHPSQRKAYADGMAALHYLVAERHIDPHRVVIYGTEVGAAVAAHVALHAPEIAGLVLENPQPSLAKMVRRQERIHVLPMWLIFTERFEIAPIVPALKMPKLVIATPAQPEYEAGAAAIYRDAAGPKQMVTLKASPAYKRPGWQPAMRDFLDSLRR